MSRNVKRMFDFINRNMSLSVGTKILVPFFVVMLIVVGSLSYFVVTKISEKTTDMELRRALAVMDATVQKVEEEKGIVETYAHFIADSQEIKQALMDRDKKKLYEILIAAKQVSGQQKVVLFDSRGQAIVRVANSPTIHLEAKELTKKGLAGISSSTLAVSDSGLEIYAVAPVRYDIGLQWETAALLLERHIGKSELEAIKKRDGVDITILSDQKVVASTLDPKEAGRVFNDISRVSEDEGYFHAWTDRGEAEQINAWSRIGTGGIISVIVPNDDFDMIKEELSHDIVLIAIISMVLISMCAALLARVMTGALRKMLRITKAITLGDFSQKIDVATNDEFSELGEAINFMADKIKDRLDYAEHLATVDGLTGLYNHRFFQNRLTQEIHRAGRINLPISLIIIDIDYFKHYNDTLGHPAGDRVLRQVGRLLRKSIRTVDTAARYGGEEFTVILVDTGPEGACEVGERIRSIIEEYPFEGRSLQPAGRLTVSAGIATYPLHAGSREELITFADQALYRAKHSDKNMVVLYSDREDR